MGLTNTQYDTIMRDYQRQQARDHDEHARRQAAVYEKIPEFAQIDAQIASASTACARRMLLDGDVASSASEKTLPVKTAVFSASCVRPLISYQADAPRSCRKPVFRLTTSNLSTAVRTAATPDTSAMKNATASVRLSLTFSICSPTCARR